MNIGSISDCDEERDAQDRHESQNVNGETYLHFGPFSIETKEDEHHEQLWQLEQAIECHCLQHRECE